MSNLVDPERIEEIVGVRRHPTEHWARAVSAEEKVYVLHSQECRNSGVDLRLCDFSYALDEGLHWGDWNGLEDVPVKVSVTEDGWLVPVAGRSPDA
jgi:hypothetical protein